MSNLFVFGDSYTSVDKDNPNPKQWVMTLGQDLAMGLMNSSCPGSSQDWVMNQLSELREEIKPEDYVIVVLTHPARTWYFEDAPHLANPNISDLDDLLGADRIRAVEHYMKYIQRPIQDTRYIAHRLGWLNNLARIRGWRKVVVMLAFDQLIPFPEDYDNLIISEGSLAGAISFPECVVTDPDNPAIFTGLDPRYNHMCLDNHEHLKNLVKESWTTNSLVLRGFKHGILDRNWEENSLLCQEQLDPVSIEKNRQLRRRSAERLDWKKKYLNL